MKTTVSQIINDYTFTTRWPVAWTQLSCGHSGKCELHDVVGNAHSPDNQVTKVGDWVECAFCDHQAASLKKLNELDPAEFSHSRFRHDDSRGFGPGRIYVYGRDKSSPTGCKLLLSLDDTAETSLALKRFHGGSPLSPTERR